MGRRKNARSVNGILLLDKPAGVSSNHILQTVRRLYHANKAGHTGTLDPLATGMLPICFGEATKISQYLLSSRKAYRAGACLGAVTDTGDSEGQTIRHYPVDNAVVEGLAEHCRDFVGESSQIPPMYSALKVDGQRLYKMARAGKTVAREPRTITIDELKLTDANTHSFTIETVCSSGTYIRTLVEDLAKTAGTGAYMTSLRRMWVSPFESVAMVPFAAIEALSPMNKTNETISGGQAEVSSPYRDTSNDAFRLLDELLLSMDAALTQLTSVTVNEGQAARFRQGQFLQSAEFDLTQPGLAFPDAGKPLKVLYRSQLIGLAEWKEGQLKPLKVFNLQ